ncbi:hypothetical protein JTB14_009414 [Gonioctena quinquepunctata]|nr:hypothetical protein JTB14_009414 [Gonioctena quinquepunctata]
MDVLLQKKFGTNLPYDYLDPLPTRKAIELVRNFKAGGSLPAYLGKYTNNIVPILHSKNMLINPSHIITRPGRLVSNKCPGFWQAEDNWCRNTQRIN